jgi:hypothetical protein
VNQLAVAEVLARYLWVHPRLSGDADVLPRQLKDTVQRAAVWWAVWDGVDGGIVEQEPVSLDIQHSVHRYLSSLEKTVTGFHWEW